MDEKKMIKKLFEFVGKYKYVIVFAVLGLAFISFPGNDREGDAQVVKNEYMTEVKQFEKRIKNVLSMCDGVGRVEVILSIDSGSEYIYANESRKSNRQDEKTKESDLDVKPSIMSEGAGKEKPVLVKEIYPEFRGAVVICDGADSAKIRAELSSAVSALTGLSVDKISVIKMKK